MLLRFGYGVVKNQHFQNTVLGGVTKTSVMCTLFIMLIIMKKKKNVLFQSRSIKSNKFISLHFILNWKSVNLCKFAPLHY